MMNTIVERAALPWHMLSLGSTVWAAFGEHGWRPGIVTGLGKNGGDRTVVHLSFETATRGRRVANEIWWRKPELKGKDKPNTQTLIA